MNEQPFTEICQPENEIEGANSEFKSTLLDDVEGRNIEKRPSGETMADSLTAEIENAKFMWQDEKILYEELISDQREDIEFLSQRHQTMKTMFEEKESEALNLERRYKQLEREHIQLLHHIASQSPDVAEGSLSRLKQILDRQLKDLEEGTNFLNHKEENLDKLNKDLKEKQHYLSSSKSNQQSDALLAHLKSEVQRLRRDLSTNALEKNEAVKLYEELKNEVVLLKSRNETLANQLSVAGPYRSKKVSFGEDEQQNDVTELSACVEKLNCEILVLKVEKDQLVDEVLKLKIQLSQKEKECSEAQHHSSRQQVAFNSSQFEVGNLRCENRRLKSEVDCSKKECDTLRKKVEYLVHCGHLIRTEKNGDKKIDTSPKTSVAQRTTNDVDFRKSGNYVNKKHDNELQTEINLKGILSDLDLSKLDTEICQLKQALQERETQFRLKRQMRQKVLNNY